ncbi:Chaperone protein DnaJ [compost metagenome]
MAKKGFLDGYKTYDTTDGFGNVKRWENSFKERMSKDDAFQILKDTEETPYTILGVQQSSNIESIKKAFRMLMMEWHPDRNQHRILEAEERSRKIIAAYTVLTS